VKQQKGCNIEIGRANSTEYTAGAMCTPNKTIVRWNAGEAMVTSKSFEETTVLWAVGLQKELDGRSVARSMVSSFSI